MFGVDRDQKTICALATAPVASAIAVIRLSGSESFKIIQRACPHILQKHLKSHTVRLAKFFNLQNEYIDQVLLTFFEEGKSYTGEESVEISCHGSPHIAKKILDSLVEFGAVTADRGEFTYRSFMNGKIDLIQAEAVLSLIESQSDSAMKVSLRQLEGVVSENFKNIEDQLIWCLAHIEASIDFSTEGLDVVDNNVLIQKLKEIHSKLLKLSLSYKGGRLLKDGIKIVLAGEPNVGKSSLLNNLVENDKAIVSPIAGTTRDVVDGATVFNGIRFAISDTAGLRETEDQIEKIGVLRSHEEMKKSDLNLFILDCSQDFDLQHIDKLKHLSGKTIIVFNKIDFLPLQFSEIAIRQTLEQKLHVQGLDSLDYDCVFVSALDPAARSIILNKVLELLGPQSFQDSSVISSARQYELVSEAEKLTLQVISELQSSLGSEFVAQTLKSALLAVQKILGLSYDDQIMDRVFKEFCIGK